MVYKSDCFDCNAVRRKLLLPFPRRWRKHQLIRLKPWDNFSPCVALRCVALRCVALRCVALRCVALRCVALRCVALRCVALRCVALRCVGAYNRMVL